MKFHDLTIPKQSLSHYFVLLLKHHFEEVEFFWDMVSQTAIKDLSFFEQKPQNQKNNGNKYQAVSISTSSSISIVL